MSPALGRRRTVLAASAVGLLLLGVAAEVGAPSAAPPAPEVVPVVTSELICPDARVNARLTVRTIVSAVTPSTLSVGTGGAAVLGTATKPASIATIAGARHAATRPVAVGTKSVVGLGLRGRAPGFALDQLTSSIRRSDHGLAGLTCVQPDNDVWFVGTGSDVGHYSTLYLTNPEVTASTVDVVLVGKNGRIDAPGGLGLLVPGNARRVVHIDQLAPGAGALAVHVTVSSGRAAAAVLDTEVRGLIPRGADWVPFADPPAKRVVVPGLGAGRGTRRLSVYAPGEGTTTVRVRLVGTQGSFAPAGAASFDIDRGRLTTVDLGTAIASDQSAAVVESDVPLVAGVRWTDRAGPINDLAFSSGSAPLTAPAVVAGNRQDKGFRTWLMVTAPDGAGRVSVQPLLEGVPSGAPRVVSVPADRTVRLLLPRGANKGIYAAIITPVPGSGPLHAAVLRQRTIDGSQAITLSVLRNARITVGVPAARPNLDVGLGR